ncbi:MAG: GntG family PLP-dependent aldolase [Gemmatimonadota bacterium]|jgi:threonine aldolase
MATASGVVDLRSDTVTRPTPGMREAIARAEVGDDVLGDDPTVKKLEERVAEILGKEAALFFPSGTMANQTAVAILTTPGTEVIIEETGHILDWEGGAAAQWAGIQLRPVPTADGLLTPELVQRAIRPDVRMGVRTSLICLENTHNAAGGKIMPLETMRAIRDIAARRGIPIHLDGARLWNASVAAGIPEAMFAAEADTVMVTLSKGLGCPVGSLLAGTAELIGEAWYVRRRHGGGMRQSGILAAAGLYALEHHRERLAEDHARARRLAELLDGTPGIRVIPPETNIVMIDIEREDLDAFALVERARARGVLLTPFTATRVRAVTHLDVDDAGIERAAAATRAAVGSPS